MNYFYSFIFVYFVLNVFVIVFFNINFLILINILTILEIALSIDNAIINAKILNNWSKKWQDVFLKYGMIIAVFGMRLLFPLIIISKISNLGILESFYLALNNPKKYALILKSVHAEISAFGGFFLLMLVLDFFFDKEKDFHWLKLEGILIKFYKVKTLIPLILVIVLILLKVDNSIIISAIIGIILYLFLTLFSIGEGIVKQGILGFLYLEILDASFSFDGVIAALAISNNIIIIAMGLGIGALFVRSMTIYLVNNGKLSKYVFLEHGAYWAIFYLAITMIVSIFIELSEIETSFGILFIFLAIYHSYKYKKRE